MLICFFFKKVIWGSFVVPILFHLSPVYLAEWKGKELSPDES